MATRGGISSVPARSLFKGTDMRGFRRVGSAARGMLWLLRATGLRNQLAKLEHYLAELDTRVLHVSSQSGATARVADNLGRLQKTINEVMADVSSEHATTVRVAESVQRMGKHIVDVAANNLTNGRLSEQFQKLEKQLDQLAAGHLGNGKLTEQFQKLERYIQEVVANHLNDKLMEQFRKLENHIDSVMAGGQHNDTLRQAVQKLETQIGELATIKKIVTDRFRGLDRPLEAAPLGQHEAQARWLQAQDLRAYERRVHSPNGEDGIIQEILHRIGVEARYFVECGVKSGTQSNCARLVVQENWTGLFVESEPAKFQELTECYHSSWGVRCLDATVSSRNIEHLLAENGVPFSLDVLAINIEGNDYWVWNALNRWRPRLIVIGYNSYYPPSKKWVMQENLDHKWDGTSHYGASLASLTALGRKKSYTLVTTDSNGKTAFFVRDDLATPERFLDPVVHYHYSPANLGPFPSGNPPRSGPHVEI
jgi:cell fate (sporulation/competence/biofilm development) regulator YlbF (YheA/YmcA/DUF963 family)